MALKLFVGGLNSRQTESDLYTYFSQFGPIRATKVVRGGPEKRSKCFGFIWLQSTDVKDRILNFKKHTLEDRVLVVNHAVDGRKSGNTLLQVLSQKKLFIGGLGPRTTSEDLQAYFSRFGEVHSAFVICQPHSHVSRRFGYVEFVDPAIADQVVSFENLIIDGQRIGCRRFGDNRMDNEGNTSNKVAKKRVEAPEPKKKQPKKKNRITLAKQDAAPSTSACQSNGLKELLIALRQQTATSSVKQLGSTDMTGSYESRTVDLSTRRNYGVGGEFKEFNGDFCMDQSHNYRFNKLVPRSSHLSVKPSIHFGSFTGHLFDNNQVIIN